jgi:TonB family protein
MGRPVSSVQRGTILSIIFDARKSAELSKQVRDAAVAPPLTPVAGPDSGEPDSAAPDGLGVGSTNRRLPVLEVPPAAGPGTSFGAPDLGLKVERQADNWRVSWNKDVAAGATRGCLSVTDGVTREDLELRNNELRSGLIACSYSPVTDDLLFQLEITDHDSRAIRESLKLVLQALPAPPARKPRKTIARHAGGTVRTARSRSNKAPDATAELVGQDLSLVRSLLRKPRTEPLSSLRESFAQQGGKFEPAKLVFSSDPIYPAAAQESFVTESVELSFRISPEGKVYNTRWVKGPVDLAQAAADAVESWRYEPARLNGAPIDSQGTATFDFRQD